MTRKQWGHGFHAGRESGERWGEIFADGKWETELSEVSARMLLLANALLLPVESGSGRTEIWWQLYVSSVAKQLIALAQELPGFPSSVHEFEREIKKEAGQ